MQRAFEILEKYPKLTAYHTVNKERVLIEIKGENNRCYRVFQRINYCSCLAFKHQVLEKRDQITCKHVIAARIALLLDNLILHEVTKEQYLMLLKSMFILAEE